MLVVVSTIKREKMSPVGVKLYTSAYNIFQVNRFIHECSANYSKEQTIGLTKANRTQKRKQVNIKQLRKNIYLRNMCLPSDWINCNKQRYAIMYNIVQQLNFFLNNFIIKASPCLLNIKSLSILNSRKWHDYYQALQLYLILPYQTYNYI